MRSSGPRGVEVPFGSDGILFSRTDAFGVIQAGNSVFRGVSGHAWSRLVGAPHKLDRHPGTPRAVFHLLWERIRAGLATGTRICNGSEDGRLHWVLAVVVPLADGYLPVRSGPGTETLGKVKAIYAGPSWSPPGRWRRPRPPTGSRAN